MSGTRNPDARSTVVASDTLHGPAAAEALFDSIWRHELDLIVEMSWVPTAGPAVARLAVRALLQHQEFTDASWRGRHLILRSGTGHPVLPSTVRYAAEAMPETQREPSVGFGHQVQPTRSPQPERVGGAPTALRQPPKGNTFPAAHCAGCLLLNDVERSSRGSGSAAVWRRASLVHQMTLGLDAVDGQGLATHEPGLAPVIRPRT